MLHRYSCIYEVRMSHTLNGSSMIRRFEHNKGVLDLDESPMTSCATPFKFTYKAMSDVEAPLFQHTHPHMRKILSLFPRPLHSFPSLVVHTADNKKWSGKRATPTVHQIQKSIIYSGVLLLSHTN